MQTTNNTIPISVEEFTNRINKHMHTLKGYFSIYITPTGQILDCGYPTLLGHNEFCEYVYNNLTSLPQNPYTSSLKEQNFTFKDVPKLMEEKFGLQEILHHDIKLFWTIDKDLLGTEDRICQDMGFVKISINSKLKYFQIVVPNSIFEKHVTAHQKETIENLSEYFNMDIITKLKSKQKDNAKLASEIKQALTQINESKSL